LEEEGNKILQYFASNRLVANASKTAMIVFRPRVPPNLFEIKLSGETIVETTEEKLLGVHVQHDLKWKKHVEKLTSEVNYALSVLRRLSDQLGKKELKTIADGLVMSKIRYCLPVFAAESLRFHESDPQSSVVQKVQRLQNDMLRVITQNRRRDRIRISDMLSSTGFMSVNQTTSYSLLIELWKAREFNVPVLKDLLEKRRDDERILRSDSASKVQTIGRDKLALNCERLWNLASSKFKSTNLLSVAKIEAKKLAITLPV